MARLTAEELRAAREAKAAERKAAEQEEQERLDWLLHANERHEQLESVAEGLYDEFDKLAKKWPSMPATARQVAAVNKLLGAVRDLLSDEGDEFADGLEDFVAAGDPPETRDVVLTLREAKDALARFEDEHGSEWRRVVRA
jgi:hypothetical protein